MLAPARIGMILPVVCPRRRAGRRYKFGPQRLSTHARETCVECRNSGRTGSPRYHKFVVHPFLVRSCYQEIDLDGLPDSAGTSRPPASSTMKKVVHNRVRGCYIISPCSSHGKESVYSKFQYHCAY